MTDQVRLFDATCFDGWALFTDPIVVTGLPSSQEIAARASIGFFIFALRDEDERLVLAEQRRLSRYTFLARKEAP